MFLRAALVVTAAIATAAAVGGGLALASRDPGRTPAPAAALPAGDPVAFLRTLVGQIVRDDYAAAWRTLHPAHKQAVSQREYVECERLTPIPGRLDAFEVRRVRDEQSGKAITVRIVLTEPALDTDVEIVHTFHVVAVGGRWAWILPEARYESYRANVCPGAPGPRT